MIGRPAKNYFLERFPVQDVQVSVPVMEGVSFAASWEFDGGEEEVSASKGRDQVELGIQVEKHDPARARAEPTVVEGREGYGAGNAVRGGGDEVVEGEIGVVRV